MTKKFSKNIFGTEIALIEIQLLATADIFSHGSETNQFSYFGGKKMVNNSCKSGNRVTNIFGDVSSVFDHLFAKPNSTMETYRPVWDVVESGDAFTVSLELPGMNPEDVSVEFEGGVLTIAGEKTVDRTDEKSTYHRSERTAGKFSRTLEFSTPVESDGIEASFNNGLLEVKVPKSEKVQPRKITVNASK